MKRVAENASIYTELLCVAIEENDKFLTNNFLTQA